MNPMPDANMAINTAIITTPEAAVKAQAEVKRKRSVAKALAKDGDITGARFELAEAADLDRAAAAILDPSNVLLNPLVAGRGGELVVPTKENMMDRPGLVDTANSDPDMLTAAASVARLDLVADAGALSLGVDAADTIQASNSLEKMLAHQMGVAHTMAMKFAADAQDELFGYKNFGQRDPHRSIEAARMANVAARLMEAYQRAALTLLRMRNGGRQVVTVQHVNISGGQSIRSRLGNRGSLCRGRPRFRAMNPVRPAPSRGRLRWTLRMPRPVVRCAMPERAALQGAGNGRSPDARRRKHGTENRHRLGTVAQGALAAWATLRRVRGEARAVLIALRRLLDEA
jgi:hypothetical protein